MTIPPSLKSLDDFNHERVKQYKPVGASPNGIECPVCGHELWDTDPSLTLMANPPRKAIHCPACEWTGSRVA